MATHESSNLAVLVDAENAQASVIAQGDCAMLGNLRESGNGVSGE